MWDTEQYVHILFLILEDANHPLQILFGCNCGVGLAEFTNPVFSVFSISVCKFANRSKSSSGSGLWEHVHNFTIKSHFVIYVSILVEEKHCKFILRFS